LTALLSYILSQLGRDAGKKKEKILWESWGGPPSTQVLRLSDETIDVITKKRYHNFLHRVCNVGFKIDPQGEVDDIKKMDSAYESWCKYLINHTRDSKRFPLLLKENISYGFRRNLWGMKPLGISITTFSMLFSYGLYYKEFNTFNPLLYSADYWILTFLLFVLLLFWLTIVTREWIKIPAFAYALRLCEAIDQLDANQ
jgi:hypothetical protein